MFNMLLLSLLVKVLNAAFCLKTSVFTTFAFKTSKYHTFRDLRKGLYNMYIIHIDIDISQIYLKIESCIFK